jgi:hypothetical protein
MAGIAQLHSDLIFALPGGGMSISCSTSEETEAEWLNILSMVTQKVAELS